MRDPVKRGAARGIAVRSRGERNPPRASTRRERAFDSTMSRPGFCSWRPRRRVKLLAGQLTAAEPTEEPAELEVRPLKSGKNGGFGAEVLNLDLRFCGKETIIEKLVPLVKKWGLLVVRGTEEGIPGDRHAEFASWMSPIGGLYSNHQHHEKQPNPAVFRLSNREEEGVPGGGDGLWHHDSLHMPVPPCYQVLHMPRSPAWLDGRAAADDGAAEREGECAATWFARADASLLSTETRNRLAKLRSFNLPTGQQHPLLNPETGTMMPPTAVGVLEVDEQAGTSRKLSKQEFKFLSACYRRLLLKGEAFLLPAEGELVTAGAAEDQTGAETPGEGMVALTRRIEQEALNAQSKSIYRHVYRPGDVVIQDNHAIAHRAPTSEEQALVTGTRVLHRCLALAEGGGTGGA